MSPGSQDKGQTLAGQEAARAREAPRVAVEAEVDDKDRANDRAKAKAEANKKVNDKAKARARANKRVNDKARAKGSGRADARV